MQNSHPLQRVPEQEGFTQITHFSELIANYKSRLATLALRNTLDNHREKIDAYIADAQNTVMFHGQTLSPFAPVQHKYSALRRVTVWQELVICLLMFGLILGLLLYRIEMIVAILALITMFYVVDLLFLFWLSLYALRASTGEQIDEEIVHALADADWPCYTVLCPLYHESAVVPQLIDAMSSLDYPIDKLQILILVQEDDNETCAILQNMQLPSHFSLLTLPAGAPRTKPRACNFGLLHATGDYLVIYDAEDIPDPLQLKKAVLTFANHGPDLACVQAKLNVYNANQNLLTRWFSGDFYVWFDVTLPGLQRLGLPIPLGGTSNHFRTAALRMVGGWDAFNVTEDCDLGLRLARFQLKVVMLDSTTYEEANSQFGNWLLQRSRWFKGFMQTYLVNMRQPLRYLHPGHWTQFLTLQFVVGAKTAVFLVNPVMWVLLAVYILFRPIVANAYHTLFPTPVLYMGMLCLIFGNFFCAYCYIMSCLNRRQYGFIKWMLLTPIYWTMMSLAEYIAMFELVFKPHYWGKTEHGFHLRTPRSTSSTTSAIEPFTFVKIESKSTRDIGELTLPKETRKSSSTVGAEVFRDREPASLSANRNVKRIYSRPLRFPVWQFTPSDPWLVAVCIIACVAGVISIFYFFQHDLILVYKDANSHLLLARRLIDSATPGFAQLGGVWLPLPHLIMQPFIWNDYLWHTGLAGSFTSMLCYLAATVYLFLAIRRITKDSRASFVGALLFALNPNILYLQTTPLSELLLIVTTMMACYHFLAWAQDDASRHLILAALGTCLATLSRYDGWFLFPAFIFGIIVIGLMKRQRRVEIEGKVLAFATLGGLGIALWVLWCGVIFGDPFYFQSGPFSSQADLVFLIKVHALDTYHNLWQSVYIYLSASVENVGLITSALAVFAFFVFFTGRRFSPEIVAGLMFVMPFVFYVVSLYTGQAAIFLSPVNRIFNARYGVEAVVPAAFFVGTLAGRFSRADRPILFRGRSTGMAPGCHSLSIGRHFVQGMLTMAVIAQTVITIAGGIISLQDGQFGADCDPHSNVVAYIAQHYSGGRILEDFAHSLNSGLAFTNVNFANVIYEGSGSLWKRALKNPASLVDWVITNPRDQDDLVSQQVDVASPTFLTQFIALVQEPQGLILFHRKGLPPLPTRSIPSSLFTEHSVCIAGNPRHIRSLVIRHLHRPYFQTGLVFPRLGFTSYGQKDTAWLKGIQEIQVQIGARWIEMPIAFSQASTSSTSVVAGADAPTLSSFAYGLHAAHALGYHVFVSPILSVGRASYWSGAIHFSNYKQEQAWFESYWQALRPYVTVAAQEGVEQLAVGTEFEWLEQFAPDALWERLIARVRNAFPGTLTYDINWSAVLRPPPGWMRSPELNMIGVSAFFPLIDVPMRLDSKQLSDLWGVTERNALDALAAALDKPIFLSEIGYRNSADAVYRTWEDSSSARADPEEQALACDVAMSNIFDDPHIAGTFFWGWDDVSAFRLRGMPASAVIHTWYTSLETE